MYQTQITNLLKEFNRSSCQRYNIHRLLNEADYRGRCLQKEKHQSDTKILLLVNQIQALEDLLDHELGVDVVSQPGLTTKNMNWGLSVLALVGLLFITVSVLAVEQIRHNRESTTSIHTN